MASPFVPKDRAKTEHIATVRRVVFSSPDRDFVILEGADDSTIKGNADPSEFRPKTTFRFFGRWQDDDRGPAFRFVTFVPHLMHGKTGVMTYLSKVCEGLGEKTASKLWDKYGPEAVEVLRSDPDRVHREVDRLALDFCRRCSEELREAQQFERTKIDLFTLTASRGFSGDLIDGAIRKWSVRAPAVVRRNPFALLGLPSAGFKRCDRLWTDLGLPKDAITRGVACVDHLLLNDPAGHTWVSAVSLAERLAESAPGCDPVRAFRVAKRARRVRTRKDAGGVVWVANYARAAAEERIAAAVGRLAAGRGEWPTDRVPVSKEDGDGLPSAHQVERLGRATVLPLGVLIGGPGTGKSHITAFLVREIIRGWGREHIRACAPTGKAAVRMTQAFSLAGIDLRATTIHSMLEIGRNGHDGGGWGFKRNRGNPLDAKFVVADEASMDDAGLMADLMDAIPAGGHLLLIGDAGQLPPVGHGAPLRDLLAAGVPHGELTEVRRNAGQIVHACVRIRANESFDVCGPDEPHDLAASPPRNLKLVEAADGAAAADVLCDLVADGRERLGFDPAWQTQVIVARNARGDVSRKAVNARLHPILNPDGRAAEGNPFKVGDKIICLKNSWMQRVEPMYRVVQSGGGVFGGMRRVGTAKTDDMCDASNYDVVRDEATGEPDEVYVANGEIGRVEAVGPRVTVARFGEAEELIKIPMGRKRDDEEEGDGGEGGEGGEGGGKGQGCDFDLAYAVSCHKAQGSQSPCVVVVGDPDAHMLTTREWLYTAVSRASKLCVLVGRMATFDKMRSRTALARRKTFLAQEVRGVLWRNI